MNEKLDKDQLESYVKLLENDDKVRIKESSDPEWYKNNLEADLLSTEWILKKARQDHSYAQNIYAALCNNEFQKNDIIVLLKDQRWSCSWRYAGGIVADMLESGDYIDWYCSGYQRIGNQEAVDSDPDNIRKRFVAEGFVTDEVRSDFKQLGWTIIDSPENQQ